MDENAGSLRQRVWSTRFLNGRNQGFLWVFSLAGGSERSMSDMDVTHLIKADSSEPTSDKKLQFESWARACHIHHTVRWEVMIVMISNVSIMVVAMMILAVARMNNFLRQCC